MYLHRPNLNLNVQLLPWTFRYNYYPGDLRIRSKLVSFVAKRDRTVQASYAKPSSGVHLTLPFPAPPPPPPPPPPRTVCIIKKQHTPTCTLQCSRFKRTPLCTPLCRVPRSVVLQQELAAVGKRYGYDAGYVQATIYSI